MMLASSRGYLSIVCYLLHQGADPNMQVASLSDPGTPGGLPSETEGQTALHMAAQFGHMDVLGELLLNQCDAEIEDSGGWTAERLAEEEDQIEARNLLRDWFENKGATQGRIESQRLLKRADEGTKAMGEQIQTQVNDMVKQMLEPMQAEMDTMRLQISTLELELRAEQDSNAAAQKQSMGELDQLAARAVLKEDFEDMVDRMLAPVSHDLATVKTRLGEMKTKITSVEQKLLLQGMADMHRQQQEDFASFGSPTPR